jgi:predicted naringenin-chalcone synthase
LATAVPSQSASQAQAAAVAQRVCCSTDEQAAFVANLYRQTGIDKRHMVFGDAFVRDVVHGTSESQDVFLPSDHGGDRGPSTSQRMQRYVQEAAPLALNAARPAVQEAGLAPVEFTHLVTVSCTGFSAPGLDLALVHGLKLAPTIQRVHVGFMGCHGAINGLRVAQAFADAQPATRVLMCAVELCSLHYFYGWDPKKLVANSLFADGAAALVGVSEAHPSAEAWRVTATGSCLFPNTAYAMTWDIGDHGFDMTLSTRVPGLIAANLRPWMTSWLEQQGLGIDRVRTWAVHPGGPRILSAVEEGLGLDRHALAVSREVLAGYGNMSSPTLLFILDRLRRRQAPRPCAALGFGPGLVVEAALLE